MRVYDIISSINFYDIVSRITFDHPLRAVWFVPIILVLAYYVGRGGMNRRKFKFLLLRALVIGLFVLAMASPKILTANEIVGELPPITILEDISISMQLFDSQAMGRRLYNEITNVVKNTTGDADVNIEFFSGNRTEIGDTLYRSRLKSFEGNQLIVLVSDGKNNNGREPVSVAAVLSALNISVFTISPKLSHNDVRISSLIGDDKTPVNAEYNMIIKVEKTSEDSVRYGLEILVDGSRIHGAPVVQNAQLLHINKSLIFSETGVHEIVVKITPRGDDFFVDNNIFYKKVDVVEKPTLLVIGSESDTPLVNVLSRIYDVKFSSNLGEDITGYPAVVLDNVAADDMDFDFVERYKNYILDGNGLLVVGGDNSFEYGGYNNSYFETLLPVKSGKKPTKERKPIGIVFLLDLSSSFAASTGGDPNDQPDEVMKALVINIIRQLDPRDNIAVIAFNVRPFTVVDFTKLEYLEPMALEERIMRLQAGYLETGGTDATHTLEEAERMLLPYDGKKNIFLFTDGLIFFHSSKESINYKLENMAERGIQSNFIGIGGGASNMGNRENPISSNVHLMIDFARSGNGIYYGPSEKEHERLLLRFGEEEKGDTGFTLKVYDKYHYITDGIDLSNTKIDNYNTVYDKSIARMLVSTKGEQPVATVWWFGLGRVGAVTTDDGIQWGSQFYAAGNGRLVSALVNWVIGDLEKGKNVLLKPSSTYLGEEAKVQIISSGKPEFIVKHAEFETIADYTLKQDSIQSYSASFIPSQTGFYALRAAYAGDVDLDATAVNYPLELSSLGLDVRTMSSIAGATGGSYYTHYQVSELEKDILDYAKKISTTNQLEEKLLWYYFVLAALILYFIDAALRRMSIIIHLRKR